MCKVKSHHFLIFAGIISLVVILVGLLMIYNNPEHLVAILAITATILGIITTIVVPLIVWFSQKKKNAQEIHNISQLLGDMINEMKRILDDNSSGIKEHLYILSYTPAFGNISAPNLYEDYKKLLVDIVVKKRAEINISMLWKEKKTRVPRKYVKKYS